MFMFLKCENIRSLFLKHIVLTVSFFMVNIYIDLDRISSDFMALLQWDMIVKAVTHTFVFVLKSVPGFIYSVPVSVS